MARAKRTARAEARRRYRAINETPEPDDIGGSPAVAPSGSRSAAAPRAAPVKASAAAPRAAPVRPSFRAAFRDSFHRVDIRSDLRWLPNIVRSKALWIPLALALGAAVAFAVVPSTITYLLAQYFIWTPPIGTLFICGFLAPRASWLFGLILGLLTSAAFAVLLYSGAWNASATAIGVPRIVPDLYGPFVVQWVVLSLVAAPFFAAAVAWYRRFLRLSSPGRARAAQSQKRGNDGRSRGSSGSQKASARR